MVECYHYSCQGESHKATQKPCQDISYSTVLVDGTSIIIVCDGHGGNRYFRSEIGAQIASEVIREFSISFVKNVDKSLFRNKSYTAKAALSANGVDINYTPIDGNNRQLFVSIVNEWKYRIATHATENPISEWERTHVATNYLADLQNDEKLKSVYGCTLMAYIQTPDYWFAFHLGDGKCIVFQESPLWCEPIPWDDRCFLNETTSLCDSDAINEFRYCYQGDGIFPMAVFLGSDGMDDSYADTPDLVSFYIGVIKMLVFEGREATIRSIEEDLPQLSAIGSRDDMSIAFVYNLDALKAKLPDLIKFQIERVKKNLQYIRSKKQNILGDKEIKLLHIYDKFMKQWSSAVASQYNNRF